MIVQPEKFIKEVKDLGAYMMNVHYEACRHLHRVVAEIHQAGMKAGVTLNPTTPVSVLEDIIADLDMVLLMSVNPGFGGQPFIENTYPKIARLRELIEKHNSHALIEVDGGVNRHNAPILAAAGADALVAGSSVFNAPDPMAEIIALKG
jgi:ribulose-phosphate 3-epimerase